MSYVRCLEAAGSVLVKCREDGSEVVFECEKYSKNLCSSLTPELYINHGYGFIDIVKTKDHLLRRRKESNNLTKNVGKVTR